MRQFFMITLTMYLALTAGCRTIEIQESDAFDAHRTITPATFNVSAFDLEEFSINTPDGETLNAWYLSKENAVATVLYFGGNSSLMVKSGSLIRAYAELPVNLLLFDYRGYGQSTGSPTVEGVKTDALAVYNEVRQNRISDGETLVVHGHSLGSYLAAFLADEASVNAYILESPITETRSWTRSMIPWIARPFIRFDINENVAGQNNVNRVGNIHLPLLVIGGTADDVTPFRMAEELYETSASGQKNLLEITGGSHNNLPNYSEYRRALARFFNSLP